MKGLLKSVACLGVFLSVMVMAVPFASAENALPSLEAGVDRLSTQLMEAIANRYFDADKRPVINVAIFDFTDKNGDITVGSRYVSDRIRLAFGAGSQFNLLKVDGFEKGGHFISDTTFTDNTTLREYVVGELKADVYLFGHIQALGKSTLNCSVSLWGTQPPFTDYSAPVPLTGKALTPEIPTTRSWALRLTSSGLRYFTAIEVVGKKEEKLAEEKLAKVIFLTQPLCDDLNPAWQVSGDGMIYDVRKRREVGSLRNRTGQMMQSRVKSSAALKELSYVIKNFTLIIREEPEEPDEPENVNKPKAKGLAYSLEPYVLPRESRYYFIPYRGGEKALRFMYLWNEPGRSKKPSARESSTGWNLFQAEADWPNMMPVGNHTATATLMPIAETDYGTKRSRAEYVVRFKFLVKPKLNVYVINYVYRMDRPEIFVRRLEVEGPETRPVGQVRRVTEIFDVYGEKKGTGQ